MVHECGGEDIDQKNNAEPKHPSLPYALSHPMGLLWQESYIIWDEWNGLRVTHGISNTYTLTLTIMH